MSDPTLVLRTADGTDRPFELPLAWLVEALEHAAPGREYVYAAPHVVFRAGADGTLVLSDENGAAVTLSAERRPQHLALLKERLWQSWHEIEVFSEAFFGAESLAEFTERVAGWNRQVPAEYLETACVEVFVERDDDDDYNGCIKVSYRRPPTPEEQAEWSAERQGASETRERGMLRDLLAKYPDEGKNHE
jgi:hypothetical protein